MDRPKEIAKSARRLIADNPTAASALAVFVIHLIFALFCKLALGVDIEAQAPWNRWDWFWQTLPMEALRHHLLQSIWYLHAQPPLFNLYGGIIGKIFGAHHLQAMQYINILLGSAASAMVFYILWSIIDRRKAALVISILLALNPALILYEAYPLYELPVAFLIVSAVFCLSFYKNRPDRRKLYIFIAIINILVLTRSAYHIIILVVSLTLVAIIESQRRRRTILICGAICLVSLSWYAKNQVQYGFFGSSSWYGMGLWRMAAGYYQTEDFAEMIDKGVIERNIPGTDPYPSTLKFIESGLGRKSKIDTLNNDDYHNINIVELSRRYKENAKRVIAYDFPHYLANVARSYRVYNCPSTRYIHLEENRQKISALEHFYSQIVCGQTFTKWLRPIFGIDICSWSYFILPLLIMAGGAIGMIKCKGSPACWMAGLRSHPDEVFSGIIIVYTILVSSLFEVGENNRFKFYVELPMWIFSVAVVYHYITIFTRAKKD